MTWEQKKAEREAQTFKTTWMYMPGCVDMDVVNLCMKVRMGYA